jgi:hypothetical protein
MACTECRPWQSRDPKRTAVAYQPREVGRYQRLPYTLLCRFHLAAIKMQNARRTKTNERYESLGYKYRDTLVEWLALTDDIRAQEEARYAADVAAAEAKQAENDQRATEAERRYTREAKRKARAADKVTGDLDLLMVRVSEKPSEDKPSVLTFAVEADVAQAGKGERTVWLATFAVTSPTYSTWEDGTFQPAVITLSEARDLWMYRRAQPVQDALAKAFAMAQAEATKRNEGWLK